MFRMTSHTRKKPSRPVIRPTPRSSARDLRTRRRFARPPPLDDGEMAAAVAPARPPPPSAANALLSLLDEPRPALRAHALRALHDVVDVEWSAVASSVASIEALYEDETFEARDEAALLASKVRSKRSRERDGDEESDLLPLTKRTDGDSGGVERAMGDARGGERLTVGDSMRSDSFVDAGFLSSGRDERRAALRPVRRGSLRRERGERFRADADRDGDR